MSKEMKGPLLEPKKKEGKKLWEKEKKGGLLKTEGPTGNPLWKNKESLNEKEKEVRKINE